MSGLKWPLTIVRYTENVSWKDENWILSQFLVHCLLVRFIIKAESKLIQTLQIKEAFFYLMTLDGINGKE